MEIKILEKEEHFKYSEAILKMLTASDQDFVPPLSKRRSTTQSGFQSTDALDSGILKYFEELQKQRIMIAEENGELMAFVSFCENYQSNLIGTEYQSNIYISTLIVKPEARGKNLTCRMYDVLFHTYQNRFCFTRTWSTNFAHITILSGFSFEVFHTILNDRGENIDTVYFIKKPKQII